MDEPVFLYACEVEAVPEGRTKALEINGRTVLICNFGGQIFAVENMCSHAEQPLERGRLKDGWISCPYHGARFDLETGEPVKGPATDPIATFPVRISGMIIEIAV